MRNNTKNEDIRHKGGRFALRFASALLAACLTVSLGTSAFAAVGGNGQSVQPSVHAERPIHHVDGNRLIQEDSELLAQVPASLTSIAEGYGGTIYVNVGETVTIHVGQRGVALFGIEGYQEIKWANTGTREDTVSYTTSMDGLRTDQYIANMKKYEAKNDYSGYSTAYCVDLYLQGNKPGVEYFGFIDGSGLAGSFYKVVVLGEGETAPESPVSSSSSSSGKGGSGAAPRSGNSAANGALADDPNNPQTVLPHLIVS